MLEKLTTILIVAKIEPSLPIWKSLGYAVTVRVPDMVRARRRADLGRR
jgi:hypothetical protein